MDTADYVIIGGGTAGLVLANRLSENPNLSVVVLEAGENRLNDPRVMIPAFWTSLLGTELDWQFESRSQVRVETLRSVATLFTNFVAGSPGSEIVPSNYLKESFSEERVVSMGKLSLRPRKRALICGPASEIQDGTGTRSSPTIKSSTL